MSTVVGGESWDTEEVLNAAQCVRLLVGCLVDSRVHDRQRSHCNQAVFEHERKQKRRRRLDQLVEFQAVARQNILCSYT